MNKQDDIIDLLNRLWEFFDDLADIDSDAQPNYALRFCAEIDEALALLGGKQ